MKVYHIHGIRHPAVIFAKTPEEAIIQAVQQGLVRAWEVPEAIEVPLPKGYFIVYDPLVGSMEQAELPLFPNDPAPEPPHVITRSGIKVYDDWRDNIIIDSDAPPVVWKAGRDVFGAYTDVSGRSRLASENSEDALSWNLFRTLEKSSYLNAIIQALGLEDEFQVLYWYRPWNGAEPLPEIVAALRRVEPRKGYLTETDVILKGQRYLVMIESKLGKPGARLRSWEHAGTQSVPASYEVPLQALLSDRSNWQKTMRRFYQLLRHLILANELCQPEVWNLEPRLLAIVNDLNRHANLHSHAKEFTAFQSCLRLPARQTHLVTWQQLLARVEATLDPVFRPLLTHAAQLTYLRKT